MQLDEVRRRTSRPASRCTTGSPRPSWLGCYVYALRDPRTEVIFYVGKGKGDRVYQHARHAKRVDAAETPEQLKLSRIREILAGGHEVGVEIIRHGMDEAVAYEVEGAVIDARAVAGVGLTNAVSGHGLARGWRPLEDIVARYAARPAEIAPQHRVILIRIRRQYKAGMPADALYEATRKWWAAAPARRRPEWAFAVHDGIVRAVYTIEGWERPQEHERVGRLKNRWAFFGRRDEPMEDVYLWTDVSRYLPRGAQNPTRYVHC